MTLSMDPRSSAPVEPGCVVLALACSQQHLPDRDPRLAAAV